MVDLLTLKVAARHQRKIAGWEGKLVGKDFRLQWARDSWKLEELPQKGKKKLRVSTMDGGGIRYSGSFSTNMSVYISENILHQAKVSSSDTYDHVKAKIQSAMDAAAEKVIAENPQKDWEFLRNTKWYEEQVYFLEVMPEGVEPFVAEGADFTVKVEWGKFEAYDPKADFHQMDPTYTQYASSSPQAARKMFQTLKANPDALKGLPWSKFDDWMKANKIGYKVHFSQWH